MNAAEVCSELPVVNAYTFKIGLVVVRGQKSSGTGQLPCNPHVKTGLGIVASGENTVT